MAATERACPSCGADVQLWIERGGHIEGPFTFADLQRAQAEGRLGAQDRINVGSAAQWQPLADFLETSPLQRTPCVAPPPPPTVSTAPLVVEGVEVVSHESIGAIQGMIQGKFAASAVRSLLVWGAINVVAWLIWGQDVPQKLAPTLHGAFTDNLWKYLAMYGGLAIGVAMLAFAGLSSASQSSAAILLDGVALLAVGVWNIAYDSIVTQALIGTSYHIVGDGPGLWPLLGIVQLYWGLREIVRFARVHSWASKKLPRPERTALQKGLAAFAKLPVSPEYGVVRGIRRSSSSLGLETVKCPYTGKLLDDEAVFVPAKLDHIVVINRHSPGKMEGFTFDGESDRMVQAWLSEN